MMFDIKVRAPIAIPLDLWYSENHCISFQIKIKIFDWDHPLAQVTSHLIKKYDKEKLLSLDEIPVFEHQPLAQVNSHLIKK